jgi:PhnB protein
MAVPWKPDGYSSVSPYIMVAGAQRLAEFLQRAFGATPLRRYDMPDSTIMHAELKIDDTVIMLADASDKYPAFPIWLHLYVPDVNRAYQAALKAGGVSVQAPEQRKGDPDRRGGVKDPAGNTWWISTQVG